MLELAQHILDIAENSIRAGARSVFIAINEDAARDKLTITIRDDGCGMAKQEMKKALDPFYTTKTVRNVGLGLPLLKNAAEATGGGMQIKSSVDRGTKVIATFGLSHLDRQPLGNISATLISLIATNSGIDFIFNYRHNDRRFSLDTRSIRKEIGDISLQYPEIIKYLRRFIDEGLRTLKMRV